MIARGAPIWANGTDVFKRPPAEAADIEFVEEVGDVQLEEGLVVEAGPAHRDPDVQVDGRVSRRPRRG